MNVLQEDLNLWRRFAADLRQTMSRTRRALAGGRVEAADGLLAEVENAAIRIGKRMEQAGAEKPADADGNRPPTRFETPLELLDTPENRRYADALRVAWEAGLAVDRQRYGDIGTDGCAQAVEMILADVELEIYGPQGRGEGAGREK